MNKYLVMDRSFNSLSVDQLSDIKSIVGATITDISPTNLGVELISDKTLDELREDLRHDFLIACADL